MRDVKKILSSLPAEASEGYGNCGEPFPLAMEGCTVLVLGCGAGRDAFVAGELVGADGKVIGVEIDQEKVDKANRIKADLGATNVEFRQGCFMTLDGVGIDDESIDLVIANMAISHAPDTQKALDTIWRVLKYSGELYFCDIFADRRTPPELKENETLKAENLAGAMYIEDFRRMMRAAGWLDHRRMETRKAKISPEAAAAAKGFVYFKRTIRAYKLPDLIEDICEQYYQVATYEGGIDGAPDYYDLDDHHRFMKGEPMDVCGNSCAMVEKTRVGKYFKVDGDRSRHGGPFPGCGNIPYSAEEEE